MQELKARFLIEEYIGDDECCARMYFTTLAKAFSWLSARKITQLENNYFRVDATASSVFKIVEVDFNLAVDSE